MSFLLDENKVMIATTLETHQQMNEGETALDLFHNLSDESYLDCSSFYEVLTDKKLERSKDVIPLARTKSLLAFSLFTSSPGDRVLFQVKGMETKSNSCHN